MLIQSIVFYFFAGVLVLSALAMITVRNPVHAALFLVLAFFTSAALWLLLEAEFLGIDSKSVKNFEKDGNPAQKRFLGSEGDAGKNLGLKKNWAYNVIEQVGNYGEIYDRALGPDTPYNLARGVNALWTDGGLMYAPPFR